MIFTIPAALAGLALLVVPVLVHMLLRRNARRIVFPTTRFLMATRAAAVRVRRPADLVLLMLRVAIVLAAVLAAAQPVLLAGWRTARWDRRVARAVAIDTSRSMAVASNAEALAARELETFASARFGGADLGEEIRRGTEWLARTPPARRELVVISDFQRGAIDPSAIAAVPKIVGIRFIRAGTHPSSTRVTLPSVSGWRGGAWTGTATIRLDSIDSAWTRDGDAVVSGWLTTSQPAAQADAATRAVAAALSFGVAPGDPSHRLHVAFANAPALSNEQDLHTPWMLRADVALRASELLRQSGATVHSSERAGVLIVRTDAAADSAAAAPVVRAAVVAVRPAAIIDGESEIATLSGAELASLSREPAPLSATTDGIVSDGVEARWLWALALVLLGAETVVRRRGVSARQPEEAHAHAA